MTLFSINIKRVNKILVQKGLFCWCVLLLFVTTVHASTTHTTVENIKYTSDSSRVPFYRLFSFHTNWVDWVMMTPNMSIEVDLSNRQSNRFSLLFTGKWNPTKKANHRWSYNVSSVKGELRKYWRTGNQEKVSLPVIERDTTLWTPLSKWSYLRRKHLSGRYLAHPRFWRAYYIGLYGAYNKFSIYLHGDGKQGDSYSFGFSTGWSVPLYKHLDGSGWDLDIGASAGLMMTAYDQYRRKSDINVFTHKKERFVHPMVQDIHFSLVYRLRTIDKKVLYGAERFVMREEKRAFREAERQKKIEARYERADSIMRYSEITTALNKSKEQLALYTDTTSYYYQVLRDVVDYTERNSVDLRYDTEWKFNSDVLIRNLEYYMNITNEMAPENQRTDRPKQKKMRKKAKKDGGE